MKIAYVTIAAGFKGPMYNTPANQLDRMLGKYTTVCPGAKDGTVIDSKGKCWDWFLGDDGVVRVIEAK